MLTQSGKYSFAFLFIAAACSAPVIWADDINFSRDVQPILAKRCYACHGPADQEAGLALNDRSSSTAELESGEHAIVPGHPNESALLKRVLSKEPDFRMPPEGDPLSTAELTMLRKWIADGAVYGAHWSFVKPVRPALPQVKRPENTRNAIDHFVLARLDNVQLAPAPRADSTTLIRRLYLDLTGMLPPPDQVAAFKRGSTTYSQIVDQLLDSDHFGERWGRHWLDLARYADTYGYERDDVRPNAWRYRDWVVQSFNNNQPYNHFIIDQLAGDLLDKPTLQQRIATGLHRMNIRNNESGINKEDYRNRETVDRVNTTSTAMLGLTLGCCQCHSHKYDPFSHAEYYSFYAFFNNVDPKDSDIEGTPDEQARYQAAKAELDAHRNRLKERSQLLAEMQKHPSFLAWRSDDTKNTDRAIEKLDLTESLKTALQSPTEKHQVQLAEFWRSLRGRQDDTAKAMAQLSVQTRHLPKPFIMQLSERSKERRKTHILVRGDFKQKGAEVTATTPGVLPPLTHRGKTPDRLDLARWIANRENPLTARVAVNHIWKHLFGRGIVTTVDDFGTQGTPPTHPELLDWLAVEFMDSGWDRKQLIRTILHSATYQQSSSMRHSDKKHQQLAFGKDNALFARQSRFRVESEVIRDIFLDACGLLHRQIGGPTVHPMIPIAVSEIGFKYKTRWIVSDRPQRYRRGLYIHFKRTNPYPTLLMFDAPESNVCQAQRNRSNTPLQALATLNDPVFVECAQAFGRALAKMQTTDDDRLTAIAMQCLARKFESSERKMLLELLASERNWYREHPNKAAAFVGEYQAQGIDDSEVAAWASVARAVLNLDEFVTRE